MISYADKRLADAEAAGDQAQIRYWKRVRARVDAAPALSEAQRDRLAVLLRPPPVEVPAPASHPRRQAA
ncbi:MAG TPA: hypothetical protein VFA06_03035 [Actinocrinis sp.]|uniref:hypothetical protein n=1 Tax=Actinocrinis sp. TaxID=1920516 RepID=UPI002D2382AA|nr:hypothetical protein [Actinocrinis sp.]HZU54823.1 hypothetical protein [Actinocrinis sp.]